MEKFLIDHLPTFCFVTAMDVYKMARVYFPNANFDHHYIRVVLNKLERKGYIVSRKCRGLWTANRKEYIRVKTLEDLFFILM